MIVAVKQLQLKATEMDRVRFLQEAAIMGQFYHPNVVTLHGVVTKDDPVTTPTSNNTHQIKIDSCSSVQIMIVLEFMPNGDLRNSLLQVRPL